MRIVLVRHGKPDVPGRERLPAKEMAGWIDCYNAAGIIPNEEPPRETVGEVGSCNVVVCSDLKRSIESAHALGVRYIALRDRIFREVGLPYGNLPLPRLSPMLWVGLFRLLWFFGYSSNSETLREARVRAASAADMLRELARARGSVALVGHGVLNQFIAEELLLNGWNGPGRPGRNHWDFGVYECAAEQVVFRDVSRVTAQEVQVTP